MSIHSVKEGEVEIECIGCGSNSHFRCPTCIKLGINDSYFCSQECYKNNWSEHSQMHEPGNFPNEVETVYNPWPNFHFTGALRPFKPSNQRRTVPEHIMYPDYAKDPEGISKCELEAPNSIEVLNEDDISQMRVACKLGREVLDEAISAVAVGVTTDEIDRVVHEATILRDCYPSPLNYRKFPRSTCTSVNECICHGIPDMRPLKDGDILNVDVTVFYKGFHADLNETVFVGNASQKAKNLVKNAHECLCKAIQFVRPGNRYRDIGNIIQQHAQSAGFSVVRTYTGHGVHRQFHTLPNVPHYSKNKAVGVMRPGHVFTIEPMINEGVWRDKTWPDNWTSVTFDGKLSAQFEETLLVTKDGCDVLTARANGLPHFSSSL